MSNAKSISVKQLRTSFEAQSQNATADSGRIIVRTSGREKLHRNFHILDDSLNKEDTKLVERHVSSESHIFPDRIHTEKSWKEEAKSEMKMILEEQSCKWKTTEDSIQELERRLSLLEIEKLKLQNSLLQKEANSCSICHLENSHLNLEVDKMDCPKGYPCIYVSPLFEEWKLSMDYHKRFDTLSVQQRWRKERHSTLAKGAGWEKSRHAQASNFVAEIGQLISEGSKPEGMSCKQLDQGLEKRQAFHCEKVSKEQNILGSTEPAEPSQQIDEDWSSHPARSSSQSMQSSENELGGGKEDMKYPISESDSTNPRVFDPKVFDRLDLVDESARRDIPVVSRRTVTPKSRIPEQDGKVETTFEEGPDVFGGKGTSLRLSVHEPETCVVSGETRALEGTIEKLICVCQELERKLQGHKIEGRTEERKQAYSLVSLQKVYLNVLREICRQLSDVGEDLHNPSRDENYLQKKVYDLKEVIFISGAEVVPLAKYLEEKDVRIEDIKMKLRAIQEEKDAVAFENIELMRRLQEVDKEAVEKSKCANELAMMSRELLVLSKSEENELTYWHGKLTELQQVVEQKSLEINKLAQELEAASKEIQEKDEENQVLRMLYASLKFKLDETKHELEEREATLERLALHMASRVEDEETRPLWGSLRHFHRKDRYKEDQVKHSKIIIKTLEDHLAAMEQIFQKSKLEREHTKACQHFYKD